MPIGPPFNLAVPGLPLEDFEEAQVALANIGAMPNPMDRFTNNTIFQPGDILDGLCNTPDDKDIALAIPGAGFDGTVPGINSPQFAAIRLAKTFSGYISPLAVGMSHFFELGGA